MSVFFYFFIFLFFYFFIFYFVIQIFSGRSMTNNGSTIILGIDGGGSKCKAVAVDSSDQGRVLGHGRAGAANPSQDFDQALESIVCSAKEAMIDAGLADVPLSDVVAGVGLAGVNLPSVFEAVQQWQHPFKNMFLTTDLHIACLGAHGGAEGAVMVIGTGSCGYINDGNQGIIYGAHGFPFGDKGSGAWVGLEAIKAVLLAQDDLGPETQLTQSVSQILGVTDLRIVEKMIGAKSKQYARLAPAVVEAAENGDAVALSIVLEGAEYLSAVAKKLLAGNPARFSLLGGLSHKMTTWFDNNVVKQIAEPMAQPEMGAIYFAKKSMLDK
jgi:glucosamine kinase